MITPDIKNIIVKYLLNEATSADMDFLSHWVDNPNNKKFFEDYVKTHYEITIVMVKPDVDSIKKSLLHKIKKDKNPFYKYKVPAILKYAALVTMLIGIGYMYQNRNLDINKVVQQQNILTPKEESITLQLDNGSFQTINLKENKKITDANGNIIGQQKNSQLNYVTASTKEELIYNTLNVPKGKRFDVVLSDGTHVFLNSGTSLRYPVKFIKGKHRTVFLTGEAYFDVVKDKKHPFIVHADKMNIKVLGTKFNVSHYSENVNINTVLVEGSVEIYDKNKKKPALLKPGFKAEWNKSDNQMVLENVDTRVYTAWIDGKLIFRNTTFFKIRNTLERQYNVIIKNNNKDLDSQLFDATFDIENITEILETFNKSYAIEYEIINNEVIIN